MIRYYCNLCGQEIKEDPGSRLDLSADIIVGGRTKVGYAVINLHKECAEKLIPEEMEQCRAAARKRKEKEAAAREQAAAMEAEAKAYREDSIDNLGLPDGARKVLMDAGIGRISLLRQMTTDEVAALPGCSARNFRAIIRALDQANKAGE